MRKAAVFLDGAYLDGVTRGYGGMRVDLATLSDDLVGPQAERIRTYYYYCPPFQGPSPSEEERRRYAAAMTFFESLRLLPRFEVRLGFLAKRDDRFEQKGVDVLLSVDLVRMSWGKQIDVAVLVAGDSDFVPAVQAAKDAGVVTRLFYARSSVHNKLVKACDDRAQLSQELLAKFPRHPKTSGGAGP
ncbi:MAG TPA: NYN domain-containing protein [Thermoplasmata archaeon]|nr:NYN domain-containing protein [Thermoplasmata archaeon]